MIFIFCVSSIYTNNIYWATFTLRFRLVSTYNIMTAFQNLRNDTEKEKERNGKRTHRF